MAQCSYMQLARLRAAYADDPWLKPPIAFGLHLPPAAVRQLPAALSLILRRHPILCAGFPGPDRIEYREPPGPREVHLEFVDAPWTHESVLAKARSPFAPGEDRLYRFIVAPDGADPAGIVLVAAIDHLVFDGYSIGVFRRELGALLAGKADLDSVFGPAAAYSEFVEEQQTFVDSREGAAAREHWLRRWSRSGLYPTLPQPDFPADLAPALRHVTVATKAIDPRLARTLPGCAALTTLAQAIHACASRSPGEKLGITAITPYANRSRRFMNSLGYFDNRVQVSLVAEEGFERTLHSATAEWMDMLRYGQYPFELIVRELFVDEYAQRARSPYLFFTSSPQARPSALPIPEMAHFTDVESFKDFNSLTVSHERRHDGAHAFGLIYNTATVSEDFIQDIAQRMSA